MTVAEMNDKFRTAMVPSIRFKIVYTAAVAKMAFESRYLLMDKIRNFKEFNTDNDPYGEHDFGRVVVDNQKYFWKFDYYDENWEYGVDPKTQAANRLLTIMRADEY